MSFTRLTTPQLPFLESHLRGTGRTMSAAQAASLYGIRNIRARMTELRQMGLRVRTDVNGQGRMTYAISARDITGSRARVLA